jgi:hypothetical protein
VVGYNHAFSPATSFKANVEINVNALEGCGVSSLHLRVLNRARDINLTIDRWSLGNMMIRSPESG